MEKSLFLRSLLSLSAYRAAWQWLKPTGCRAHRHASDRRTRIVSLETPITTIHQTRTASTPTIRTAHRTHQARCPAQTHQVRERRRLAWEQARESVPAVHPPVAPPVELRQAARLVPRAAAAVVLAARLKTGTREIEDASANAPVHPGRMAVVPLLP